MIRPRQRLVDLRHNLKRKKNHACDLKPFVILKVKHLSIRYSMPSHAPYTRCSTSCFSARAFLFFVPLLTKALVLDFEQLLLSLPFLFFLIQFGKSGGGGTWGWGTVDCVRLKKIGRNSRLFFLFVRVLFYSVLSLFGFRFCVCHPWGSSVHETVPRVAMVWIREKFWAKNGEHLIQTFHSLLTAHVMHSRLLFFFENVPCH